MLTRNSMLISEEAVFCATEIMAKAQPWEKYVRNGQTMSANAARKILNIVIEGADSDLNPVMTMAPISLHAIYALSIHAIRHPKARMASTDRLVCNRPSMLLSSC